MPLFTFFAAGFLAFHLIDVMGQQGQWPVLNGSPYLAPLLAGGAQTLVRGKEPGVGYFLCLNPQHCDIVAGGHSLTP